MKQLATQIADQQSLTLKISSKHRIRVTVAVNADSVRVLDTITSGWLFLLRHGFLAFFTNFLTIWPPILPASRTESSSPPFAKSSWRCNSSATSHFNLFCFFFGSASSFRAKQSPPSALTESCHDNAPHDLEAERVI